MIENSLSHEVFHFHPHSLMFYLLLACLARGSEVSQQAVCKHLSQASKGLEAAAAAVVQSSASTLRFSPLWAFVALTQGHISFEFLQLWAWFATMTKWMIIWCCVLIINQRRIEAKNCDNYFHYDLGAVRTVASGTQLEQEIRRGKLLAFSSIERRLLYHDWWCVHCTVQYSTRCSWK